MTTWRDQGRYSPLFSTLGFALGSLLGMVLHPQHLVPAVEPAKGRHPRGSPVPLLTCPPCLTHSTGGEV